MFAGTIPDRGHRSVALVAIARLLAAADPGRAAALIDQALAVADTIPDCGQRSEALEAIAQLLAAADPASAQIASCLPEGSGSYGNYGG